MIPSRRRLAEHLVPDEGIEVVAYGRLVDESVRGTVVIGLTDRRILCLAPDGDLVDVDYASICTIRSFIHSRLTFDGVDSRLIAAAFGLLAVAFALAGAALAAPSNPTEASGSGLALVVVTIGATIVSLGASRLTRSEAVDEPVGRRYPPFGALARLLKWGWNGGYGLVAWGVDRVRRVVPPAAAALRAIVRSLAGWTVRIGFWTLALARRVATGVWVGSRPARRRVRRTLDPVRARVDPPLRRAGVDRRFRVGADVASDAWTSLDRRCRTLWRIGRERAARVRVTVAHRPSGRSVASRLRSRARGRSGNSIRRPTLAGGLRWLASAAALVAVLALGAILLNGTGLTVGLFVALSIGCLWLARIAIRGESDHRWIEISRRRERELTVHTVDGDSVRLLVDERSSIDTELSRLAATASRPTDDPTVPEVVAG
ncbi:hypothetical protein [Halovivax gelatinilyticus]|uniref:hypothetical protein n=1 Tax=Halovivax gelatinilyticus TaxID=2961597 RepID=UPI0020CA2790|nr:hypothetical protein [Halovivax gelatinilyticus]